MAIPDAQVTFRSCLVAEWTCPLCHSPNIVFEGDVDKADPTAHCAYCGYAIRLIEKQT